MTEKDPIKMIETLIDQRLTGFGIDGDKGTVTLTFETGFIEFEGEDFDAYVELKELN